MSESVYQRNNYIEVFEDNIVGLPIKYSQLEDDIFSAKPVCGGCFKLISTIGFLVISTLSAAPFIGAAYEFGNKNIPLQYTLLVGAGIGFTALNTWALVNLSRLLCPISRQIKTEPKENICLNCMKTTALIVGLLGLSAIAAISEYSVGFMTYYYDNNPVLPDLTISPVVVGICNIGLPLYSLCLLIKKIPELLYNMEYYLGSFCKKVDVLLDSCSPPDPIKQLYLKKTEGDKYCTISRLKFYKSEFLSLSKFERENIMTDGKIDPTQAQHHEVVDVPNSLLNKLILATHPRTALKENAICKFASIFFQCVAIVIILGGLTFRGILSFEGVEVISNSFILKVFVVAIGIFSTMFVSLHVSIKTIKSFFSYFQHGRTDNLGLHFYAPLMCILSGIILAIAGLSIISIIQVIKDFYGFDYKYLKIFIMVATSLNFFILIGNALFDFISFLAVELIRKKGSVESKECLVSCEEIDKLIEAVDSSKKICKTVSTFIKETERALGVPSGSSSLGGSHQSSSDDLLAGH